MMEMESVASRPRGRGSVVIRDAVVVIFMGVVVVVDVVVVAVEGVEGMEEVETVEAVRVAESILLRPWLLMLLRQSPRIQAKFGLTCIRATVERRVHVM